MSGTDIDVPNLPKCPVPVIPAVCLGTYRTEHTLDNLIRCACYLALNIFRGHLLTGALRTQGPLFRQTRNTTAAAAAQQQKKHITTPPPLEQQQHGYRWGSSTIVVTPREQDDNAYRWRCSTVMLFVGYLVWTMGLCVGFSLQCFTHRTDSDKADFHVMI